MESTIASIPSTSAAATVTNSTPSHIIIFDFDYSLINVNSDTYVPEYFAPELESYIKNEIKLGRQWTALMNNVVHKLFHEYHITPEQINKCLGTMPYFPEIQQILLYAGTLSSSSTSLVRTYILSDANTIFINEFLKAQNLTSSIYQVITNPAYYDNEGCLHIHPYTNSLNGDLPHLCPRCPINLCKGKVLDSLSLSKQIPNDNNTKINTYTDHQQAEEFENELKKFNDRKDYQESLRKNNNAITTEIAIDTMTINIQNTITDTISNQPIASATTTTSMTNIVTTPTLPLSTTSSSLPRIIYIGDGSGDLCPCLRLNNQDIILARENYPLYKKLHDPLIKPYVLAKVVPWNDGKVIHDTIMGFLKNEL